MVIEDVILLQKALLPWYAISDACWLTVGVAAACNSGG